MEAADGIARTNSRSAGDDDAYVTLYRASQLTGKGVPTLYGWVQKGLLPAKAKQRGRRTTYLVRPADLEAAIEDAPRGPALDEKRRAMAARYQAEDLPSTEEVGLIFNCTASGVQKSLERIGVPRRGHFEALQRRRAEAKSLGGLLDEREVAAAVKRAPITVARHRRGGDVPAVKVLGQWFYPATAGEALVRAVGAGLQRRADALDRARRAGTKPRRGTTRTCACGCGRQIYLHPARARRVADREVFYSYSCWGKRRWKTGRGVAEEMVRSARDLVDHNRGRKEGATFVRRLKGGWGGHKPPARLSHRPRGRPPKAITPNLEEIVGKLAGQGWGYRMIAADQRVKNAGGTPYMVRKILKTLPTA